MHIIDTEKWNQQIGFKFRPSLFDSICINAPKKGMNLSFPSLLLARSHFERKTFLNVKQCRRRLEVNPFIVDWADYISSNFVSQTLFLEVIK